MSTTEIKTELRALRAGRAVYAANLTARLGTHLRMLCDAGRAGHGEDVAVLRRRLFSELNGCAMRLPDDMAIAVRASLALHADAADPRFQGRVAWLARQLEREDRTALRRIDEAELLLAEEITRELSRRRATPAGGLWHFARFDALVRLDTPVVEVYEDRRIVADCDGLDEIAVGVSVPATTGNAETELHPDSHTALHTEVRYGARLIRRERPIPLRSQLVIALPRPLRAGQTHDFGLVSRIGPGQRTRPHYVLTATCPCDLFRLRIRFSLDSPPQWVRRVCGEPVRLLDTPRPTNDLLSLDAAGEVLVEFAQPELYLAYGAQFCQTAEDP